MNPKSIFTICLFLFFILKIQNTLLAQNELVETQTWMDITQFWDLRKNSAIGVDGGARGIISSSNWSQYYLRPTFRHVVNQKFNFAIGTAVFQTNNKDITDLTEWRFFQEVNYDWPKLKHLFVNHRLRFEQRTFNYDDEDPINFPNHSSNRLRYQFTLETIDIKILKQNMYFVIGAEYFQQQQDDAESFVNNSRFLFVIGHRLSPRVRYELQYIFQRSRLYHNDGLEGSEHIFRLRIFRVPKFLNDIDR